MFQELTLKESQLITGGGLEDAGYALGVALGTAGTVVSVAFAPFTGGQSLYAAATCAGIASYGWGCLVD